MFHFIRVSLLILEILCVVVDLSFHNIKQPLQPILLYNFIFHDSELPKFEC